MLLFIIVLYYSPSETYLFSNERQESVHPGERGGTEELGLERGEA